MMETLVSVILPVYNGEKYLSAAVQSVFAQSCKDWELIIVDDCSTDSTPSICSACQKAARVTTLRSDRRLGVSGARNTGLETACGKYIVFLDADDTLTDDSLEVRTARMEARDLAMGVFNWSIIVDEEQPRKTNLRGLGIFDPVSFFGRAALYQAGNNLGFDSVWDKIFRNDVIKDNAIRFHEEFQMYEDSIFSLEYAAACNGPIEVIDISILNYYRRSSNAASLTARFQSGKFGKMHHTIREYFLMLSEQLDNGGIFSGAVKEGFYHGYVNKMIGALYTYGKNMKGHLLQEAGILFEDDHFMTGIMSYECKSRGEDPGIIEILKEKNVDRLSAYIQKRTG